MPVFEVLSQRLSTDKKTGHLLLTPSPTCMKEIKETECCHFVWIVSGDELFVGEKKETWWNGKPCSQFRREAIYMPAEESYAPLAAYVINACKKMNCNDEITRFKVKLDSLNGVRGALKN